MLKSKQKNLRKYKFNDIFKLINYNKFIKLIVKCLYTSLLKSETDIAFQYCQLLLEIEILAN